MLVPVDQFDEWQEVHGPDGQVLWELNPRTGETRKPQPKTSLTPAMIEAEKHLSPLHQSTIETSDGRLVTPGQHFIEQGMHQSLQNLMVSRTYFRQVSQIRNEDRPLGAIVTHLDNWKTDRAIGKAFSETRDNTLAAMTLMDEERRKLIADVMGYDQAEIIREDRRWEQEERRRQTQALFDAEHSPEAIARQWELQKIKVQGEIEIEKIKAQAQVEQELSKDDREHELVMSVIDQKDAVRELTDELQFRWDNDPNTATLQMIGALKDLSTAISDATGTDESLREKALNKMLQMNAPALMDTAKTLVEAQRTQMKHQTRKKPSPRAKKEEGEA